MPVWVRAGLLILLCASAWIVWALRHSAAEEKATNALVQAVFKGDLASVKAQIAAGADVNAGTLGLIRPSGAREIFAATLRHRRRYRGTSVLNQARAYGRPDIMKVLLEAGADPNNRGEGGHPPLVDAAATLGTAPIDLLLDHGAVIDAPAPDGATALLRALRQLQIENAHLLVRRGADLRKQMPDGMNAMMLAASLGDTQTVQACLQAGMSCTTGDKRGKTPLYYAVFSKGADVVRLLLDHGAPVDVRSGIGATPLHQACARGNLETVRLLMERGANVNLADRNGRRPCYFALSSMQKNDVAFRLLKQLHASGTDVKACDSRGTNALHLAAFRQDTRMIDWLLKHDLPIAGRDFLGRTPLHLVSWLSEEPNPAPAIERLLKAGANVNAQDNQGNTPLLSAIGFEAAHSRETGITRTLVTHGASVTIANAQGETPLSLARKYKTAHPKLWRMIEEAATAQSRRDLGHNSRNSKGH
jgi:ankyrin repeat protein